MFCLRCSSTSVEHREATLDYGNLVATWTICLTCRVRSNFKFKATEGLLYYPELRPYINAGAEFEVVDVLP